MCKKIINSLRFYSRLELSCSFIFLVLQIATMVAGIYQVVSEPCIQIRRGSRSLNPTSSNWLWLSKKLWMKSRVCFTHHFVEWKIDQPGTTLCKPEDKSSSLRVSNLEEGSQPFNPTKQIKIHGFSSLFRRVPYNIYIFRGNQINWSLWENWTSN